LIEMTEAKFRLVKKKKGKFRMKIFFYQMDYRIDNKK